MTAVLPGMTEEDGEQSWGRPAVPGWGLWFDLTPPELVNARRVRTLRRWIAAGLVVVVGLVAGAWFLSTMSAGHANSALADEQSKTAALRSAQQRYTVVTTLTGATTTIQQQLGTLLADDVDTSALLGSLRSALPSGVRLERVQLSVDAETNRAAAAGDAASLDTSGHPHIGTVTLSGTASGVDGVATYVSALGRTKGFTDVVPTSSSGGEKGFTFSITLALTDQVLTHRFDTAAASASPGAGTTTTTGAGK